MAALAVPQMGVEVGAAEVALVSRITIWISLVAQAQRQRQRQAAELALLPEVGQVARPAGSTPASEVLAG